MHTVCCIPHESDSYKTMHFRLNVHGYFYRLNFLWTYITDNYYRKWKVFALQQIWKIISLCDLEQLDYKTQIFFNIDMVFVCIQYT